MVFQIPDIPPWRIEKFVLPQDTDHAGVMWHGSYLNWLEEARVDALQKVGLPYYQLSLEGLEMPVVSLDIKYLRSIQHGEEICLESWCLKRQGVRWPWVTRFLNKNNECMAEAIVYLVLVSRNESGIKLLKKVPDYLSNALKNLQLGPT